MSPRDNFFGEFRDHTRIKHYLLSSYLKAWAKIMLEGGRSGRGRKFPRIVYVDAFAGAGRDDTGQPGSPLLAAEIATAVNGALYPGKTGRDRGMQVIAIELDDDRHTSLKTCLQPHTAGTDSYVYVRKGSLDAGKLKKIREFFPSDPMLFFLDPFGIGGLDGTLLPELLSRPHAEALVLFHDEGAVRLDAKGKATPTDFTRAITDVESQTSLFGPTHEAENVKRALQVVNRSLAGHKSNPQAREHMRRAFGNLDHEAIIDATPEPLRQAKMIQLYSALLLGSGATRVLPFSVETEQGRHKYTLLHASKEPAAVVAMKDAMHRARSRMLNDDGPKLLTADDVTPIVARIREQFGGKSRVRWQGDTPCVLTWALANTDLMQHEADALKTALEPFVVERRPMWFQF